MLHGITRKEFWLTDQDQIKSNLSDLVDIEAPKAYVLIRFTPDILRLESIWGFTPQGSIPSFQKRN